MITSPYGHFIEDALSCWWYYRRGKRVEEEVSRALRCVVYRGELFDREDDEEVAGERSRVNVDLLFFHRSMRTNRRERKTNGY